MAIWSLMSKIETSMVFILISLYIMLKYFKIENYENKLFMLIYLAFEKFLRVLHHSNE